MITLLNEIHNLDKCLQLNPDYKINDFLENVLIIDDWYKNFNELQDFCFDARPTLWSPADDEYIDGKFYQQHTFDINENSSIMINELKKLIKEYYDCDTVLADKLTLDFNYFKLKKEQPNNYHQLPHTDPSTFAAVVYIDNTSDGGTVFYRTDFEKGTNKNFLVDINDYRYTNKLIPHIQVNSLPNRIVIAPTKNIYHGGFFNNINSYLNNWRITQVIFMDIIQGSN